MLVAMGEVNSRFQQCINGIIAMVETIPRLQYSLVMVVSGIVVGSAPFVTGNVNSPKVLSPELVCSFCCVSVLVYGRER